jgi:hypothetical protein
MKDLWRVLAPVSFILTLATWLVFYYSSVTRNDLLGPSETTFVFGFWFAVTIAVRWVWRRIFKKPPGDPSHDIPKP